MYHALVNLSIILCVTSAATAMSQEPAPLLQVFVKMTHPAHLAIAFPHTHQSRLAVPSAIVNLHACAISGTPALTE